MDRFRSVLVLLLIAGTVAAGATLVASSVATAQSGEALRLSRGTISGSVVDAHSDQLLAAATVTLQPDATGALAPQSAGGSAFLEAARAVLSDSAGRYRFQDLPPGRYRLQVERAGYRPASVVVDLRGSADSRVGIALHVEPIPLQSVTVTADRPDPYALGRPTWEEIESARLAALQHRQRQSLVSDAREITHADLVTAVTLAETDLFRALHRLPGISTRDDYAAELWMRGAPWDQTRVYFDGMPLFNPLHAVGAFSGFSANAVEGAWVHPGVRPAALGEGAAGVVDLRTRRATGEGELNGLAELSLLSSSLTLDQRILDGRGAWMLSGRRSYLDWLTRAVGWLADDPALEVPLAFADLIGRFDLQLDEQRTLVVSGIWQQDWLRDRGTGAPGRSAFAEPSASWGNAAGRITLESQFQGYRTRHTLGWTRYRATADASTPAPVPAAGPLLQNTLHYGSLGSEIEPQASGGGGSTWTAGYRLVFQSADYEEHATPLGTGGSTRSGLQRSAVLPVAATWAEWTWAPADRLSLQAGLRVEAGEKLQNAEVVRPAPRLAARYQLDPGWSLSAGAARSFQYVQALAPAPPSVGLFAASHLWLLAGEDVPAIRADIVTLGVEGWLGQGWLASVNSYRRRSTGVAVPDPTPGEITGDRARFVTGENSAHGVELSARRLTGWWTASAAYSYGVSEMELAGMRFAAAQDRRHSLDATALLQVSPTLRMGAAYTAATGAPFTRIYPAATRPAVDGPPVEVPARVESPNGQRGQAYASLDVLLDWNRRFRGWDLGAYLQLRNALGRENPAFYRGSKEVCGAPGCGFYTSHDEFTAGMPRLPVFGVRARF